MKLKIEIDLSNDAFQTHEPTELVRILREIANEFEAAGTYRFKKAYDINGNPVGKVQVTR